MTSGQEVRFLMWGPLVRAYCERCKSLLLVACTCRIVHRVTLKFSSHALVCVELRLPHSSETLALPSVAQSLDLSESGDASFLLCNRG